LGWECKYDLAALVKEMIQSDIKLMEKDQYLKDCGYTTLLKIAQQKNEQKII